MIEIFSLSQIPGTDQRVPDVIYFIERKTAHVFEYFVLALLLFWVLGTYHLSLRKKFSFIFFVSLFWAIIDEVHQLFIFGREGKLVDVGIDSIGVLLFFIFLLAWRAYPRIES